MTQIHRKNCIVTKLKKRISRKQNFQEFQFFEVRSQHLHRVTILKKLYKLRQYYLAVRERRQLRKTRPLERIRLLIYLQYSTGVSKRSGEFKMELLHLGKSVAKIIWAGPLNPFKLEPDPFITYWHDGSKLLISTGVRFYKKVSC